MQYNKERKFLEFLEMRIEKRCPALVTNHAGTMNLLFPDFNSGSRQFRFGMNNNVRLASKGDFSRTGMTGVQLIDKNVIDIMENYFIFNFIRFSLKFRLLESYILIKYLNLIKIHFWFLYLHIWFSLFESYKCTIIN